MGKQTEEQDMTPLWVAYKENHDKETRDKLIEHYLPLVNIIAGRIAISLPAHVDRDDLISSGFFGLMDAVERYDCERQNKFETYAGVRIRGAMLDYLRARDWMPTSLRQKARNYEKTVSMLEGKLGRNVTDEEVAEAMGMQVEDVVKLLAQINVATVIPLDEYIHGENAASVVPGPSANIEKKEMQETLAKAIEKLPPKEQQVVSLYYYEELTMREISLVLHITEGRVCQLHTKAIFRLRGTLARTKALLLE